MPRPFFATLLRGLMLCGCHEATTDVPREGAAGRIDARERWKRVLVLSEFLQ